MISTYSLLSNQSPKYLTDQHKTNRSPHINFKFIHICISFMEGKKIWQELFIFVLVLVCLFMCVFFLVYFFILKSCFHHIFHNHKFVSKQYHSTKKKNLCGHFVEKPNLELATNSYTFILYRFMLHDGGFFPLLQEIHKHILSKRKDLGLLSVKVSTKPETLVIQTLKD